MTIYKISFGMATPVVVPNQGVIMGDALLFAAATRLQFGAEARHRTPDQWVPIKLPVRRIEDGGVSFYAVSAVFSETDWKSNPVKNLQFTRHSSPLFFSDTEIGSGRFRGLLTSMEAYVIPWLYFYVDVPDVVQSEFGDLVATLSGLSIGRKINRGFGQVREVKVEQADRTSAIIHEGQWLRPVPIEYGRGILDGYRMALRIEPPYFHTPNVLCLYSSLETIRKEDNDGSSQENATIRDRFVEEMAP